MAKRTRPPAPSVARGAALVVVAVLVGLVLLREGIDTSVVVQAERPITEPDAPTPDEQEDPEPEPVEPVVRPPEQVLTAVLNGSGVAGAAGVYTTALAERGYQTLPASNANARVPATEVYFTPGFEREAAAVATAIGAAATPQPLPSPPPGDVGAANVVVVLGPDIASVEPPPVEPAPAGEGGDEVTADPEATEAG